MATFNLVILWIIFIRSMCTCAALHSFAPSPDLWGWAPKGAMNNPSTLQGVKARGWAALSVCLWAGLSHAKGRGKGQIPSLCLPLWPGCQSSIFISLPIPCNALIAQTPSHSIQGLRSESSAQPELGWCPRRTYIPASGVCPSFFLFQVGLTQRKEKQSQGPSGSTWTLLLALAFPSEEGFVSLTLAGRLPTAPSCHQPCPTSALCQRGMWLRDVVPQEPSSQRECVSSGPILLTVNAFGKPWSLCKIKGCGPHACSREGRSGAACWKGSACSQSLGAHGWPGTLPPPLGTQGHAAHMHPTLARWPQAPACQQLRRVIVESQAMAMLCSPPLSYRAARGATRARHPREPPCLHVCPDPHRGLLPPPHPTEAMGFQLGTGTLSTFAMVT